jgi:hypothetical protein
VIAHQVQLLLEHRLGALGVMDHRHVVPIDKGRTGDGNTHHPEFVSESVHCLHSHLESDKFGAEHRGFDGGLLLRVPYHRRCVKVEKETGP